MQVVIERTNTIREVVMRLKKQGIEAEVVSKPGQLSKDEYELIEGRASRSVAVRTASVDMLALMELAVNTKDQLWFDKLAARYRLLATREERAREELGMTVQEGI